MVSVETAKAASSLPIYGQQEGPDLQDVLTHSSTLLNSLTTALNVFTDHQHAMRSCYKRIRHREEELDELKRRRRTTGAKAEQAEKKLAKMGPENKGLPGQTELLERLRGEMRAMDTDIYTEETKLGDFKRQ
jgi:DNA repair ATPase RecN